MRREFTQSEIEKIRKDPDEHDWRSISYDYILSEEFIREFKNQINWRYICRIQVLSENFIREFQNKVD